MVLWKIEETTTAVMVEMDSRRVATSKVVMTMAMAKEEEDHQPNRIVKKTTTKNVITIAIGLM